VREADAQAAVGYDFGEGGGDGEAGFCAAGGGLLLAIRRGGCGSAERDVEVAFDELQVWGDAAEEGVDGGRG
jgi:hypothetical protein